MSCVNKKVCRDFFHGVLLSACYFMILQNKSMTGSEARLHRENTVVRPERAKGILVTFS
jgi:hypothetical protein